MGGATVEVPRTGGVSERGEHEALAEVLWVGLAWG